MNYSRAIFLINDDVRGIRCQYDPTEPRNTTVFKSMDPDIKVDDYVVVQTSIRHEMTVVKVTEVDVDVDLDYSNDLSWVIQTVDTESFAELQAKEQTAIDAMKSAEKRRRRAELRESLFKDQAEELKGLELSQPSEE